MSADLNDALQFQLPLSEGFVTVLGAQPPLTAEEEETIERALAILSRRHQRGETLDHPRNVERYLRLRLGGQDREVFGCIFLDARLQVIAVEEIFRGTVDAVHVHPRVVVQRLIHHAAYAVIAYHNHLSGVSEPSERDLRLTTELRTALGYINARLIDHLVVSTRGCTSLRERGYL